MEASPSSTPGLKRSLSVWAAVGLSVALMAPSMAANINPQGSALHAGRAVPLTFLIAAVGVLLVAYSFVRLCQYFHHAGSVYAFVGATLGPRTGVVAGWGLLGTYTFYAVVTSAAAGIFGTAFLQEVGIWHNPPTWAPFVLLAVALLLALWLAIMPARRGAHVLLSVEGTTVALILVVTAVVLVRLLAGNAPGGHTFTLERVLGGAGDAQQRAVPRRGVRLPVVRRVRGGGHPGRGGPPADPGHPAGHPRHGDLRRPVLRDRHRGRGDGLRRGPGGRQGVHQLAVAAGRPRLGLRRQLGRRRDHAGHGDQRVRLLPGLRGRGGPAGLRAVQGHGRAARARPEQLALGHPGLGHPRGRGDGRRSSSSSRPPCPPTPTRSTASCGPAPSAR